MASVTATSPQGILSTIRRSIRSCISAHPPRGRRHLGHRGSGLRRRRQLLLDRRRTLGRSRGRRRRRHRHHRERGGGGDGRVRVLALQLEVLLDDRAWRSAPRPSPPWPPCSLSTTTAISGSSAGAKRGEPGVVALPVAHLLLLQAHRADRDHLRGAGLARRCCTSGSRAPVRGAARLVHHRGQRVHHQPAVHRDRCPARATTSGWNSSTAPPVRGLQPAHQLRLVERAAVRHRGVRHRQLQRRHVHVALADGAVERHALGVAAGRDAGRGTRCPA